ncbi:hypothetical protein BDF22DRAFT_774468 [Syncephalis plumigaleata]|nr:hypothetical protein BDF22DRAFT_774468 [Syncephalis plumigaleata]
MRLLFCYTTLAIATIVVLVSYATQTLAIRGGLTGGQNPGSYARRYMDQVAAKEGLSKPRWYEGGTAYISFARVNYNGQSGFMKCAPNNDEEKAFELLMAARETLTGSYAAYRDLVAYPLKRIRINTGDVRFDGNCYVYRYINGVTLEDYWKGKLYAERLLFSIKSCHK